jgi:cellulose synthase/poly-beta-1,6-N-acetylglucosamine synthase-like glycosyltransferase
MSSLLTAILLVVLAFVLVPVSVLLLQVVCAAMPRRPAPIPLAARPRLAVLVPAHNESSVIRETLDSVLPQLEPGDRLVVVADNCSDDTARVAAGAGAEVAERRDSSRRGKGYALDFGLRCLGRESPQVVVIVDADCEVTAGAIDRIARLSASTGRPVQALYLMKAPPSAGTMALIAEFAWVVKNLVRPLGFLRLALPCQLMGTGMAFPWAVIRSARLASGHIVEDMKLGLDLARAGRPPLFCPEALVRSCFPSSEDGRRTQRTRWEHGHLGMILSEAPRLLWEGLRGKGSGLLALALDMAVPPLALLALSIIVLVAVCAAHALLTLSLAPLVVAGMVSLMFGAAIGLSWLRFGLGILSPGRLPLALIYAVRKLPLYLKFVVSRQVEWVRSKRDER